MVNNFTENQNDILNAKKFLEDKGYIVKKDYSSYVGKWVSYKGGFIQVLHGEIMNVKGYKDTYFEIKRKNGCIDYVNTNDVYKYFDNKQECYAMKEL